MLGKERVPGRAAAVGSAKDDDGTLAVPPRPPLRRPQGATAIYGIGHEF